MASRAVELKKAKSASATVQERNNASYKVQRRQTTNEFDRNKSSEPQRSSVISRLFKQFKEPSDYHKDKHSSKNKKSRPLSLELTSDGIDRAFISVAKTASLAIESSSSLPKSIAEEDIAGSSKTPDHLMNRWRSVGNLIVTQVVPEETAETLSASEEDEAQDSAVDIAESSLDEETRNQLHDNIARQDEVISEKLLQKEVLLQKLFHLSTNSSQLESTDKPSPRCYKSPLKDLMYSCCVDADRITATINSHIQPELFALTSPNPAVPRRTEVEAKSEQSTELLQLSRSIHDSLSQLLMLYDNSPKINQVTICSYAAETRSNILKDSVHVPQLFVSPVSSSDDPIAWDSPDTKLSLSTSDSSLTHTADDQQSADDSQSTDVFALADDNAINRDIPAADVTTPHASQSTSDADTCSVH